jgi:hypothetical protein
MARGSAAWALPAPRVSPAGLIVERAQHDVQLDAVII